MGSTPETLLYAAMRGVGVWHRDLIAMAIDHLLDICFSSCFPFRTANSSGCLSPLVYPQLYQTLKSACPQIPLGSDQIEIRAEESRAERIKPR
jgi:hypothetical protein